jgi:hypothetical protein
LRLQPGDRIKSPKALYALASRGRGICPGDFTRRAIRTSAGRREGRAGRGSNPLGLETLLGQAYRGRWWRRRRLLLCTSSQAQTGGRDCECCEDLYEFHENLPSFHGKLLKGTLAKRDQLTTTKLKKISPVAASRIRWF